MMNHKQQREFLERMGLVIVIVSVVALINLDAETLIISFIGAFCMILTFGIGLVMWVIPDKMLEWQWKNMKLKVEK